MRTAVIYVHPYDKSFNHAILETLKEALASRGEEYDVIDLYADKFDPTYHPEELALFSEGKYLDPLIEKYHSILLAASRVVFIFPIWWSDMPAILKGFFDKTMLPGFGYKVVDGKMAPGLTGVSQTLIFTTSEAPTAAFAPYFNDYFIHNSLDAIGMNNASWHNCPAITSPDPAMRKAFLASIPSLLQ